MERHTILWIFFYYPITIVCYYSLPTRYRVVFSSLHAPEFGVETILRKQCFVIVAFFDPSVFEHEDGIGILHCREAVSDSERRSVLGEVSEAFLDPQFRLGVYIAGRFI